MTASGNPDDDSVFIGDLDVPPAPPRVDEDSEAVLEEAVASLATLRYPASFEDAAAELQALASLISQAEALLPGIVARALDQDYSWRDVACCLGSTPEDARCRVKAASRREPPLDR